MRVSPEGDFDPVSVREGHHGPMMMVMISMVLPLAGGTSLMFTMRLIRMRMKVIPRASSGSSTKPALHLILCKGRTPSDLLNSIHCIQGPMSPHFDLLLRIGKGF